MRAAGLRGGAPGYYAGVLALLLVLWLLLPWRPAYFIADDWSLLLRYREVAWPAVPQWFLGIRFGWYRPVFEVLVALAWQLWGLFAPGYRLLALGLYALTGANLGILGEQLTGDRRVGALAAALSMLLAPHAEPLLWFAAANELLAGLFVVLGISAYVRWRLSGRFRWLAAAAACCAAGLASKETALVLPVLVVAYDLLWLRTAGRATRRPAWFAPPLAFAAAGGLFALARALQGSPYTVDLSLTRLATNVVYYAGVEVLAVPHDYALLASIPRWQVWPWPAVAALALTGSGLLVAGLLWWRRRAWRDARPATRALAFAVVWALAALAPVLPIVAERTAFMSSLGVALGAACLFVAAWQAIPQESRWRRAVLVAAALYLAGQAWSLGYRSAAWSRAAQASADVMAALGREAQALPADAQVWLLGLPDHDAYALVFRNAFPSAARVLRYPQAVNALLDSDWADWPEDRRAGYARDLAARPGTYVFRYTGEQLAAIHP